MSHVKKFEKKQLSAGEKVLASCEGYTGKLFATGEDSQKNGALIVTDRRVVFFSNRLFGSDLETIPTKNITSVETTSKLGHKTVTIHTSHDAIEFKTLEADTLAECLAEIDRQRHGTATSDSQPTPAPEPAERLQQLSELHKNGILTDAEYKEKRAALVELL